MMIEKFKVQKNPFKGYDIIKEITDFYDCDSYEMDIVVTCYNERKAKHIAKMLNEC